MDPNLSVKGLGGHLEFPNKAMLKSYPSENTKSLEKGTTKITVPENAVPTNTKQQNHEEAFLTHTTGEVQSSSTCTELPRGTWSKIVPTKRGAWDQKDGDARKKVASLDEAKKKKENYYDLLRNNEDLMDYCEGDEVIENELINNVGVREENERLNNIGKSNLILFN